jgi:phage baseplate assembly protein W
MKGEVPFDPLFGSSIHNLLFEKMSPVTEILLKDEIEMALQNHEPRIVINNIEVTSNPDQNLYEIDIAYLIVYLNEEVTLTLDLNIQGI